MRPRFPLIHPDARALCAAAPQYPGTVERRPKDYHAFKVGDRNTFLFIIPREDGGFACSLKLPYRAEEALKLKLAAPMEYGMAAHGWVTLNFAAKAKAPLMALLDWLDESWRVAAPKKLSGTFAPPSRSKRLR
jgi:predicted DNA-binding protein (MmcQ/YjbR family)